MKLYLRLLLLAACLLVNTSSAKASDFPKISLKEALARASSENKNVLVYISAKWCGPCKRMDKSVFPDEQLQRELSKGYIALEVDGESWRGKPIVEEFKTRGYPYFLILSADRQVLRRGFAYMDVAKFKEFLSLEASISPGLADHIPASDYLVARNRTKSRSEIGVRVGPTHARLSSSSGNSKIGYELGGFVSISSGPMLFRPGLSLIEKGEKGRALTYLQLPFDIGLDVYKSRLLGVGGAYRVLVSPYSAVLLNSPNTDLQKTDYGLRYGGSVYIGDTSQLELILSSELGFKDIDRTLPGSQKHRLLNLTVAFTL